MPSALRPVAERIAFVGGLHRSGTTPLARWLASHPDVSGLQDTGVPEDEGQHLQSVYPPALAHGGPGRFALDPDARLTADSPLITPDAADRLVAAWTPYWDTDRPVLLEKSPPNLIRMPFLRSLFPTARFVMIVRHPIAVCAATSKWAGSDMEALLRNWVSAHELLVADAGEVGQVMAVRYEDLMAAPDRELDRLFSFLSVPSFAGEWTVREGVNERYFSDYYGSRVPWRRARRRRLAREYESRVASFGYSLTDPATLRPPSPDIPQFAAVQ